MRPLRFLIPATAVAIAAVVLVWCLGPGARVAVPAPAGAPATARSSKSVAVTTTTGRQAIVAFTSPADDEWALGQETRQVLGRPPLPSEDTAFVAYVNFVEAHLAQTGSAPVTLGSLPALAYQWLVQADRAQIAARAAADAAHVIACVRGDTASCPTTTTLASSNE